MSRKVLFVHDGPLYANEKTEVFGIHYTEEIKQRYLQLGDTLTFCLREKKISSSEETNYSRITGENFEFVPFPDFKSMRTYLSNKPKAKNIIRKLVKNHDVIVVRMPSASGSMAIKAARLNNIPYLVEMVACTYDAYRFYNWKGKLVAPYKLRKVQNIIKECTHVVYVTKNFLQERYPTNGISIHCSNVRIKRVPENILIDRLDKIDSRAQPLVLGSIGILSVLYKGQADVINALYKLKTAGLIYNYKIVGQGDPSRLQNLIDNLDMADGIEIIGSLPSDKINDFLKSIDLYIQPSKTEGLPRAVIEAMSMACPALGSNVGGIPELLSADCLFPAGNIDAIANKIKSITQVRLREEAEKNFNLATEYQIEILEQRRSAFYKMFLKNSGFEE